MSTPLYSEEVVLARRIRLTETYTITHTVIHYDGSRRTGTVTSCDLGTPSCYSHHGGNDYSLVYDYVLAAHDGVVVGAEWFNPLNHTISYGLHVRIQHQNGYRTIYGHLSTILVHLSDPSTAGIVIGISGNVYTKHRLIGLNPVASQEAYSHTKGILPGLADQIERTCRLC